MDYLAQFNQFYASIDKISDPRVQDWLLIKSPAFTYIASLTYIILATKVGPYLMRNKEPFNLKSLLIIYNVSLLFLNFHIFKELLIGMIHAGYSWPCQPCTLSYHDSHIRIAAALWWYYISKLIEFADTLFFVLRKKKNQITFLHVYHHSTMPMLWWMGMKWTPCGQSAHAAILNAFIHIIMYFYYGMAALGPQYQKYLWWKKYLTVLQLVQFFFALLIGVHSLYTNCDFPRWMSWSLIVYMVSFLILFGNFYLQAYIKKKGGVQKANGMNGHLTNGTLSKNDKNK